MDPAKTEQPEPTVCHVVAMPYPGRSHINAMMNLCKLMASKTADILIGFVVTEEWLGFISSEPKPPAKIRFATVPNCIPSEVSRGKDFPGFMNAVNTKMEVHFEELLDRLQQPVKAIVADTHLVDYIPVYPIGPAIPYLELEEKNASIANSINGVNYLQWLDSQPPCSVLYISMGSFLSVSNAQMDEIIGVIRDSGVRSLWVSRGETGWSNDCSGDMSLVVPWCNQLKVLCHSSIGGFWTHCGWNSTLEAVFAGVPMLTYPIFWDQVPISKHIVEDWKIGWKVKKDVGVLTRREISELVKRFVDKKSDEMNAMRQRAKELQKSSRRAIAKGGSSDANLDAFIRNISEDHGH
ncbi:hypothetical protein ACB092_11G180100 [Castanea dentata]